jgi:hypothetical protein
MVLRVALFTSPLPWWRRLAKVTVASSGYRATTFLCTRRNADRDRVRIAPEPLWSLRFRWNFDLNGGLRFLITPE